MVKWVFLLQKSEHENAQHLVRANTFAAAMGALNLYLEAYEPKMVDAPRQLLSVGI